MTIPANLRYTKEHEWVKIEGKIATVGVTFHAQNSLGDIVFCELPKVGALLTQHQSFGVVESVKAVSDLYAPVSGRVLEINSKIVDEPALVNQDPYQAWMIKVEVSAPAEFENLLDAQAYQALVEEK